MPITQLDVSTDNLQSVENEINKLKSHLQQIKSMFTKSFTYESKSKKTKVKIFYKLEPCGYNFGNSYYLERQTEVLHRNITYKWEHKMFLLYDPERDEFGFDKQYYGSADRITWLEVRTPYTQLHATGNAVVKPLLKQIDDACLPYFFDKRFISLFKIQDQLSKRVTLYTGFLIDIKDIYKVVNAHNKYVFDMTKSNIADVVGLGVPYTDILKTSKKILQNLTFQNSKSVVGEHDVTESGLKFGALVLMLLNSLDTFGVDSKQFADIRKQIEDVLFQK